MGTRNMTMVIDKEGITKVAQYGQWDGYPSGVGVEVLSFLQDKNKVQKLKDNLHKVRFLDHEGKDKDFIESYDKNAPELSSEPDNRTKDQKSWFKKYISRDLAAEILTNIADSDDAEIILSNSEYTAKGYGWVEWSYVINLKEETLTIYGLLDRPAIKSYPLNNLPDSQTFIHELEGEDEED